ncbi:GNAT family N-acetyltransferase [Granulicatella sp. zg-ZJ]|uniref:GNAT family N-acetyltransferase n=1 Tax=unclassified Granulicatella TaxID=2630493 RepID=UPI0013C25490|nr:MULTISPECIES: GNAT family N-acetyltransferase [unclassified Granulicatella]NEW63455.1 GNAT family N-acetyltransferase [Granulicatella sp. zg-ZJ]NEW65441.1 GNAT family N-acetyltransferase [Granulicatella sp. zg-84]QMI85237.1 GNAT family N-acetyltransferase [Carnobacteriaceae bacterium zg-84]
MHKHIFMHLSENSVETSRYIYEQNERYSERYDSNVLYYKVMPTLEELKEDIAFVKEKQANYQSEYVHLSFPENECLPEDIEKVLKEWSFDLSTEVLMCLNEEKANFTKSCTFNVTIEKLTEKWLEIYFKKYDEETIQYGNLYREQAKQYIQDILQKGDILLAVDKDTIIGDVILHYQKDFIEIDNFQVDEAYQRQGVGTLLQKAVLHKKLSNQKLVLIAEQGSDAHMMYQHQGYEEIGFYIEGYFIA